MLTPPLPLLSCDALFFPFCWVLILFSSVVIVRRRYRRQWYSNRHSNPSNMQRQQQQRLFMNNFLFVIFKRNPKLHQPMFAIEQKRRKSRQNNAMNRRNLLFVQDSCSGSDNEKDMRSVRAFLFALLSMRSNSIRIRVFIVSMPATATSTTMLKFRREIMRNVNREMMHTIEIFNIAEIEFVVGEVAIKNFSIAAI